MELLNILATQGLFGGLCVLLLTWLIIERVWSLIRADTFAPAMAAIVAFYVQDLSSFHVVATGTVFLVCLVFLTPDHWRLNKI